MTKTKDSKRFTAVSDGFGGVIIPDEAVELIQKERGYTPSDPNWKQTSDMTVLEACAGTVLKVTKTKTIVRVAKSQNAVSKDGTITIDSNDAEVGDRVMHFLNGDGSSWSITCHSGEGNASLSEYEDGESIIVALTPAKGKKGTGKLDIVPTVEKHVAYPRMAAVDGVRYPWIIARDDNGIDTPFVFVRTKKGWTNSGQLVAAQHAENVAVARANEGGTAPTKRPKDATIVLIRVKNLAEVVAKLNATPHGTEVTVNVDEEFIPVTNLNVKRRGIFGGIVISKNHDPKLAHGWYTRKPSAADAPAYDWLLRALYGAALEKFNFAPVAEEAAA